ncbi:hypothetical protein MBH78_20610 [Oceanimonas sp. NS1]|nr:hypothetical protein [Oceanimonas sp. NS1]
MLPVPIESQLIDNPLIEQVCVVGSGLAQPVALVQLADSAAARDRDELATALGASIEQVNHTLESHQRLGACWS